MFLFDKNISINAIIASLIVNPVIAVSDLNFECNSFDICTTNRFCSIIVLLLHFIVVTENILLVLSKRQSMLCLPTFHFPNSDKHSYQRYNCLYLFYCRTN